MSSSINEAYIKEVMQKTGWSGKETAEKLENAKKRIGITAFDYVKYNFWAVPEEQQAVKYVEIIKNNAKKRVELEKKKSEAVAKVMCKTGWSYAQAEEKILDAQRRTGVTYGEYFFYHFYELDEATQEDIFVASSSKKIRQKYDVNKESIALTFDKGRTNTVFAKYLNREWCINNKVTKHEFVKKFANSKKIIYKPIRGGGGRGIEVYEIDPDNAERVYDEISVLPEALIEEYIVQHPRMSEMCASSVNTVRIVTISSYSQPVTADGKHMDIAYAALRIGGGTSFVDNFHSGGMTAAVDLETGVLVTDAANMEGEFFKVHPVSGTVIKGFEIPFFADAVKMVREACKKSKIEGCIGWDIAFNEKGPMLIEVNHNPGPMLLTAPYIAEKKGMKHVMDKYL